MKIKCDVLMVASLPTYLGARQHSGLGNVVWGLTLALTAAGVSVAVAARGRYYTRFTTVEGVPIFGIGLDVRAGLRTLNTLMKRWREFVSEPDIGDRARLAFAVYFLAFMSRRIEFRCLHIHHVTNQVPLAARWLGIQAPVVAHVHSYTTLIESNSAPDRIRAIVANTNRQLKGVDHVVHVSHTARELGLHHGVRWDAPDVVVYNGIRYTRDDIEALSQPRRRRVICFAGAFLPVKGVAELLGALRLMPSAVEEVLWVGSGPLRGSIMNACMLAGLPFKMVGQVSNPEVVSAISTAGLLAVPSKSESFGQVYIEALLMGTPVLGYHEILQEFRRSFCQNDEERACIIPFNVNAQPQDELAELMAAALDCPPEVPESLRSRLLNNLHWSALVPRYRDLYASVKTVEAA